MFTDSLGAAPLRRQAQLAHTHTHLHDPGGVHTACPQPQTSSLDVEELKEKREEIARKRIIYTITTRGENLMTLRHSFDSVETLAPGESRLIMVLISGLRYGL